MQLYLFSSPKAIECFQFLQETEKPKNNPVNPVNPVQNIIMKHEELTHTIIGCAYTVFNKLGFGFLETVVPIQFLTNLALASWKTFTKKP